MAFWAGRDRVAVGLGPDRVRLLVGRGNGTVKALWSGARDLPAGALSDSLRTPVVRAVEVVDGALNELVHEARGNGLLRRRPEVVSVVASDGSMRIAVAPLEGDPPAGAEGAQMARWVLRELLPVDPESIRADWSVLQADNGDTPKRWLLSVGGEAAVLAEYEALVERQGWRSARIVPWTFAAAVAAGGLDDTVSRQLVLCESDGALACIFEADGIPRFHRTWRAPVAVEEIGAELPALRRYVNDHLEMTVGRVCACGPASWTSVAAAACRDAGLQVDELTPEAALLGALTT